MKAKKVKTVKNSTKSSFFFDKTSSFKNRSILEQVSEDPLSGGR